MENESHFIPEEALTSQSTETEEISIEEKIKQEELKLKREYEHVPNEGFTLYFVEEEREKFRFDVEAVCRHALAIGAEDLIFLDQSARGYGLLANKILPIMRLELAEYRQRDPDSIPIPAIHFADLDRDTHWGGMSFIASEIRKKLAHHLDKHTVMVVDEASNSDPFPTASVNREGDAEDFDRYANQDYREKRLARLSTGWGYTLRHTAKGLQTTLPSIEIDYHLCDHHYPGGWDAVANPPYQASLQQFPEYRNMSAESEEEREELIEKYFQLEEEFKEKTGHKELGTDHQLKRLAYGIQGKEYSISPTKSAFVEPFNEEVTLADTEYLHLMGFSSLKEYRERVRLEQSMIAKRSLNRVIERSIASKDSETEEPSTTPGELGESV